MSDDSQSLSRFLAFINEQLDVSGLEDAAPPSLSDEELEQIVMPLIRADIYQETLKLVAQLMRSPQHDHWRAQLAPLHREVRDCLAQAVARMMQQRYPDRLSETEWLDVTTFVITLDWLVRKQIDGGDSPDR